MYGRWIFEKENEMFRCSNCGDEMVRNCYPYCAWCGAKMLNKEKYREMVIRECERMIREATIKYKTMTSEQRAEYEEYQRQMIKALEEIGVLEEADND